MIHTLWKQTRTAWLLLAIALAACTDNDRSDTVLPPLPEEGGNRVAAFTTHVPGMISPSSRALDATKEQEVAEVDVIIFENGGNTLVEYHRIASADLVTVTGGYRFKVRDITHNNNITAAVVANAAVEVAAALAALAAASGTNTYIGETKADFLDALQIEIGGKWNTSATGYWRIPMYGEAIVPGNIYSTTIPDVQLVRMLAKVDVVNTIAPTGAPVAGNFELTAVHVANYNTNGYLAPAWNPTTGGILPLATTPNLPTDPGAHLWTANGDELTYTLTSGQTSLANEIYLFEASALSATPPQAPSADGGLRLILEGNYTSTAGTNHYYYPVDFTSAAGATMPVLRNNRYQFTIAAASGRGYDSLAEAVAAWGVMANLHTRVLVVDESGIANLVWDGQYFFGLGEQEATLPGVPGRMLNVKCLTNYAAGWEVDTSVYPGGVAYQGAQNGWLAAAPAMPGNPSSDIVLTTLAANSGGTDRKATLHLKSGRLTHTIEVTQAWVDGLYVGMFGGELRETYSGSNEWQFERPLFAQTADEGAGTYYPWKTTADATPGTTSTWDGKTNTLALNNAQHPAGYACMQKNTNSSGITAVTDPDYVWYLPAQDQLMAVWGAYASFDPGFQFSSNFYWSSTEAYGMYAWIVYFYDGFVDFNSKTASLPVRCVRE